MIHFSHQIRYTTDISYHGVVLRFTMGAFIITFLARNDFRNEFQGDLGDDKRKAVLIMGFETPFRDAAFISTFSGVELRFPNDFQGDFCR